MLCLMGDEMGAPWNGRDSALMLAVRIRGADGGGAKGSWRGCLAPFQLRWPPATCRGWICSPYQRHRALIICR